MPKGRKREGTLAKRKKRSVGGAVGKERGWVKGDLTEKREGAKPQTSTLTNKTCLSAPGSFFLDVLSSHLNL